MQSRGAGIIGQPYAVRNAGLVTGTALLIGLTVVVDWTIRLIVINSKLSGTDSFQATVQHCFGKSGLIAISLAQWLLYVLLTACGSKSIDSIQRIWRHGSVLRRGWRHNTKGLGFDVPFVGGHVVSLAIDQQTSHHDPAYSWHILPTVALPGHLEGMKPVGSFHFWANNL
jgi:amino acid permease